MCHEQSVICVTGCWD